MKESLKAEWKYIIHIVIESYENEWGIDLKDFYITKIMDEWRELSTWDKEHLEEIEYLQHSYNYRFPGNKEPENLNSFPHQIDKYHYYVEYNDYLWQALLDIQEKHKKLKERLIGLFSNGENFEKLSIKYEKKLKKGDNDEKRRKERTIPCYSNFL